MNTSDDQSAHPSALREPTAISPAHTNAGVSGRVVDGLNIALLSAVVIALWLATRPYVDMAVNDDFAYAFTVQRLAETGRFTFNGWSTAMLGAQALWALPFVKLLGFSHDTLRVSMLPISVTCAALTYGLHRRFDIRPAWSLFATMVLVTSPLFTPWSASFMTDVPGLTLTVILFHLVFGMRSAKSVSRLATLAIALAAVGVLGGSVRQSVFPIAGVAFLIECWHRWPNRRAFVAVASAMVLFVAASGALILWASSQDYYLPEQRPGLSMLPRALGNLLRLMLDGVLYTLPLLLALVPLLISNGRRWVAGLALLVVGLFVAATVWPAARLVRAPWTGNTITVFGMLSPGEDAPGARPEAIPDSLRVVLAAVVVWLLLVSIGIAWRDLSWPRIRALWTERRVATSPITTALFALLVLGLTYLCLLIPRAAFSLLFDRYLLVVVPIGSIALLWAYRDRIALRGPAPLAWVLVAFYAVGGAVVTSDHFAELRARLELARQMAAQGVPRTQLVNGIGFDAWTQLQTRGYLNDPRIVRPKGAYRADRDDAEKAKIYWILPLAPIIAPRFLALSIPSPEGLEPGDTVVPFQTILPPRTRFVSAREINWIPTDQRVPASTLPTSALPSNSR